MKHASVKLLVSLASALSLLTMSGCATTSSPPVVGAKLHLTPLPADVTEISPDSSEEILRKLSDFREKLKQRYGGATTK